MALSAANYSTLANVAVGFFDAQNQRDVAEANRATQVAASDARQRVRYAENVSRAGKADLARFEQSMANQANLRAQGRTSASARAALAASGDAAAASTFEGRIAAAQRQGALAVSASASGVSGGTTSIISGAIAMQTARREYAATRSRESQDTSLAMTNAARDASTIAGMDQRTIFTALDRTLEQPVPEVGGNDFTDLLGAVSQQPTGSLVNLAENAQRGVQGLLEAAPRNWDMSNATRGSGD